MIRGRGVHDLPEQSDRGSGQMRDFRIRPLPWAHASHAEIDWAETYLTFGPSQGMQRAELDEPPTHGNGWLVGRTWAFLIELLDGDTPVFRILYVDAAASPGFVAPWPPAGAAPIDVHIACMPGFDLVDGYPTDLIAQQDVKYVLAGHWEDFFRPRAGRLEPVPVLDDEKMSAFVLRVARTIGARDGTSAPINKDDCETGWDCGPHGAAWSVPIPGETFWFRTGGPRHGSPRRSDVPARGPLSRLDRDAGALVVIPAPCPAGPVLCRQE